MTKPELITLGCRLNAYESEVMREHANNAGLDDTVIINTCAVTKEAVRRAEQMIRRTRRRRPAANIIVTGCAVQIDPERFSSLEDVDHVIGNDEKTRAETFQNLKDPRLERVRVNDIMSVTKTASHMIEGFGSRIRAYVQIQNGCDHRCTFCIIPFGRGPSRSVPAGEVVSQIAKLVDNGHLEVVLTGVDITSYGHDLPGTMSLGRLVRHILAHIPDLKRLRLSSIDQVEVEPALLDAIANEERLMPHLHLSLQSGDDMILKRMKRRHTRKDAIAFCKKVRELRPGIVFGADLIAGFPTETDAMFENTLDIIETCGLTYLHVFPFSPREGTPAARMPQVPGQKIKFRGARLRKLGEQKLKDHLNNQTGKPVEIFIEHETTGRTPQFALAKLNQPFNPGATVRAKTTHNDGRQLYCEVLS